MSALTRAEPSRLTRLHSLPLIHFEPLAASEMTAQKPVAQDEVQRILDAACAEPHDVPGAVFLSMDRSGTYLARVTSGVRGLNKPDQKMSTDTAFIGFSCTKVCQAFLNRKFYSKPCTKDADFGLAPTAHHRYSLSVGKEYLSGSYLWWLTLLYPDK